MRDEHGRVICPHCHAPQTNGKNPVCWHCGKLVSYEETISAWFILFCFLAILWKGMHIWLGNDWNATWHSLYEVLFHH